MMKSDSEFINATDPENILSRFFGKNEFLAGFRNPSVSSAEFRIPRVLHQIWLGSPLPLQLKKLRQTWIRQHPEWVFKLWTDSDIGDFECRDLMESTTCFGQKSDVLRAEIIHKFGGVYVDLDYECFRPMDSRMKGSSFVAGLRWILQAHLGWPQVWRDPLVICNSLFGAEAGHPLLAKYLAQVRENWNDRSRLDLDDKELDRISLSVMGGAKRAAHIKETGLRTYLPFHDVVYEARETATVFPPAFFNPRLSQWIGIYAMPQFWRIKEKSAGPLPKLWKYSRVKDYSIACHWSKASWL